VSNKIVTPTVNDKTLFRMGLHTAVELFKNEDGSSQVGDIIKDAENSMGGEDYAFFSEKIPSCMFMIGHQSDDPATANKYARVPAPTVHLLLR